jgi:hypothetical protein
MRGHVGAAALAAVMATALIGTASAEVVAVTDAGELREAVEHAAAGHVIELAPGVYDVAGNIWCTVAGTADAPIVVRAQAPGDARIRFDAVEGFVVAAPYWTFESLDIEGVCVTHDACEHAFHVVGAADHTTIRGNVLHEFNAMIKGNGSGEPYEWPDDVLIEGNELFNSTPRSTSSPVTPIDVVGGRRWVVRSNFIRDFAKVGGDDISYAAFLKGNSRDGVFEGNLVVCELLHSGGVRLGLSFGGGGSGPDSICEDGTCTPEHQDGIMRNNVIVNCPADVGIYVNEGQDVRIVNNTLFRTTGIDVRFAATSADVRNNILSGAVRARDGATLSAGTNLDGVSDEVFEAWFADPGGADLGLVDGSAFVDLGETLADVTDDFCGNDRDDGRTDIGAVEYDGDGPCDTTRPGWRVQDGEDAGPDGDADADADADADSDADADAGADADASATPSNDGCGCAAPGRSSTAPGLLVLTFLMAVARRRGV